MFCKLDSAQVEEVCLRGGGGGVVRRLPREWFFFFRGFFVF